MEAVGQATATVVAATSAATPVTPSVVINMPPPSPLSQLIPLIAAAIGAFAALLGVWVTQWQIGRREGREAAREWRQEQVVVPLLNRLNGRVTGYSELVSGFAMSAVGEETLRSRREMLQALYVEGNLFDEHLLMAIADLGLGSALKQFAQHDERCWRACETALSPDFDFALRMGALREAVTPLIEEGERLYARLLAYLGLEMPSTPRGRVHS